MATETRNVFPEKLVRQIVFLIVALALLIIPIRVLGYGYFPPDDVRRHAAKVVNGKPWNEILVLRKDIKTDSHPGWHAILSVVRTLTRWDVDQLMIFSIIALFICYCIVMPLRLRFPEVWLLTLVIISVADPRLIKILLQGRPYIITMSSLLVIFFLWDRLKEDDPPRKVTIGIVSAVAASVCIHASWYLFVLPIAALFIAREWKACSKFSLLVLAGIAIGATLTLNPFAFLGQTFFHMVRIFTGGEEKGVMAEEFRPSDGDQFMVVAILGLLAWRYMRGKWDPKKVDNPVFILGVMGWILAFTAKRFWFEWGVPAFSFWIAHELQESFAEMDMRKKIGDVQRIFMTLTFAVVLFLSVTNDVDSRWTKAAHRRYLDLNDPAVKEWLPAEGGVIYNSGMDVFFDTFRKNPRAPWRYQVGFEAAMMPDDDLKIYRYIRQAQRSDESLRNWVKKMTAKDMMIIRRTGPMAGAAPKIPELEWRSFPGGYWIGRLPRAK
ncbi:MAG: hypothetical protein HQL30_04715 [Candidatus Omnitrophica bacterium]|nr:hypothetical protein [Candidatus Omnitrophota bacterium]